MTARLSALILLILMTTTAAANPCAATALPWCRSDLRASTRPPVAAPSLSSPGVCQARVTLLQRSNAAPLPAGLTHPRYTHLGATTSQAWSGVGARLEVGHPAVRPGSVDFLAARIMAKAQNRRGLTWIEAGWAETGWGAPGRQRIYTYDTRRHAWAFYEQYSIKPGDRIWLLIQAERQAPAPAWQAWLWWGDSWHLLTRQRLRLPARATIEQYIEVHAEESFEVPMLHVDQVVLKATPPGAMVTWDSGVATAPGGSDDGYCLNWGERYHTWRAGSCYTPP